MVLKAAVISPPASVASSAASASMLAMSTASAPACACLLTIIRFALSSPFSCFLWPSRRGRRFASFVFLLRGLFARGVSHILDRRMLRGPQNVQRHGIAGQHDLSPFRLALDDLVVEPAVGAAPAHVNRLTAPRADGRCRILWRLYPFGKILAL